MPPDFQHLHDYLRRSGHARVVRHRRGPARLRRRELDGGGLSCSCRPEHLRYHPGALRSPDHCALVRAAAELVVRVAEHCECRCALHRTVCLQLRVSELGRWNRGAMFDHHLDAPGHWPRSPSTPKEADQLEGGRRTNFGCGARSRGRTRGTGGAGEGLGAGKYFEGPDRLGGASCGRALCLRDDQGAVREPGRPVEGQQLLLSKFERQGHTQGGGPAEEGSEIFIRAPEYFCGTGERGRGHQPGRGYSATADREGGRFPRRALSQQRHRVRLCVPDDATLAHCPSPDLDQDRTHRPQVALARG
mmetsp:Transcript_48057/g.112497  ORF Transcript_48057/g.112497 Transcript_48057/m.112497 type:complete len:304 (+) Transcript_48057:225-1136(+)